MEGETLLNYIRCKGPRRKVREEFPSTCCKSGGFFVDTATGKVFGRCLELDRNPHGHFLPIYYYNRSWRFVSLFTQYDIKLVDQKPTLRMFEKLEKVWEEAQKKKKYSRIYFLTQKLLLQEICKRLGIQSSQPPQRPISDLKRYLKQLEIFEDLWNFCIA